MKYLCIILLLPFAGAYEWDINRYTTPFSHGALWWDDQFSEPANYSHPESCQLVEVGGFLKQMCIFDGVEFFKCLFSEVYYRVLRATCQLQAFNKACENDPTFYQACGHNPCGSIPASGDPNSPVCLDYICVSKDSIFDMEDVFYVDSHQYHTRETRWGLIKYVLGKSCSFAKL